ncbi:MAG: electron transfer flavoprotein subunit beta/FixA family protein [Anaerolineae bacterium]|nr:electron transfer flavoprotein subunit beta/FixA family protein [Anaerolineae bacterium]
MAFNIVVLLKRVPDTESKITLRDNAVVTDGLNFVLDPYAEYGLEKALQLVEQHGGKVTAVLFGPEDAKETIRKALAVGADEAIHIVDPALEGGDAGTTARVLAAALKKIPFDMVWAGKQAVDDDNAQVPVRVAELLDLPHVNSVIEFEPAADGKAARCVREVDGERDVMVTSLPAVFTAQQGLGEVRYPSLKGIMGAKKKPITDWNAAALGIDPAQVGKAGARVEILKLEPPPARPPGKIIPGDAETAAKELARLLHEEAKVI